MADWGYEEDQNQSPSQMPQQPQQAIQQSGAQQGQLDFSVPTMSSTPEGRSADYMRTDPEFMKERDYLDKMETNRAKMEAVKSKVFSLATKKYETDNMDDGGTLKQAKGMYGLHRNLQGYRDREQQKNDIERIRLYNQMVEDGNKEFIPFVEKHHGLGVERAQMTRAYMSNDNQEQRIKDVQDKLNETIIHHQETESLNRNKYELQKELQPYRLDKFKNEIAKQKIDLNTEAGIRQAQMAWMQIHPELAMLNATSGYAGATQTDQQGIANKFFADIQEIRAKQKQGAQSPPFSFRKPAIRSDMASPPLPGGMPRAAQGQKLQVPPPPVEQPSLGIPDQSQGTQSGAPMQFGDKPSPRFNQQQQNADAGDELKKAQAERTRADTAEKIRKAWDWAADDAELESEATGRKITKEEFVAKHPERYPELHSKNSAAPVAKMTREELLKELGK